MGDSSRVAAARAESAPPLSARARWLAIGWVVGLLGYSVARALVVGPVLGPYGVNPWIFLSLDVGSALPLAIAQVKLVQALRERAPARIQAWTASVAVAFLTPYAYLVLGAGRPLPDIAYAVIGGLVLLVGGATAWRIRRGAGPVQGLVDPRRRGPRTGGPARTGHPPGWMQ